MRETARKPLPPEAVAGGGLLSRRLLLGGGLALGGAAAGLDMAGAVRAEAPPAGINPDWVTTEGLPARGYGLPAPQEDYVRRALIQPYKDLTPAFSFSGTPLQHLEGTIMPNGLHYEVHHGGRPKLDPAQHRLMIHGLVERPLAFDLEGLARYPTVSATHFLECSGNSFFNAILPEPLQAGCDLLHGLVSNAEWAGVPLAVLLDEAGVKPEGRWAIAVGNDAPSPEQIAICSLFQICRAGFRRQIVSI